ncbi:MAG: protein phosphatase 2C domain-containing protein [Blastocatellia bacterium]|nr:protein phosphatase 2C domain-containing protein [Blastocatellia bacterium]
MKPGAIPPTTLQLEIVTATDVGRKRLGNEDNFLVAKLGTGEKWTGGGMRHAATTYVATGADGILCAVADGMGGALAGEVASQLAVNWICDLMQQTVQSPQAHALPLHEWLRLVVEQVNLGIHIESQKPEYSGMGTTLTAVGVVDQRLYVAQIGDSRAHLYRNQQIYQLTKDQSLVQQLVDMGVATEEEAEHHPFGNVVLQALGASSWVNVAIHNLELCDGDVIMLCSDGLSGKVRRPRMREILETAGNDLERAATALIEAANAAGGEDNITVLLLRVTGVDIKPARPEIHVPLTEIARHPELPQVTELASL